MAIAQYRITAQQLNGIASLQVSGEIDFAESDAFYKELCDYGEAVSEGIELDLSTLRFVDSSGMHALVRARQAVIGAGRSFTIVDASRPVRRVFAIAGLGDLFEPEAS